MSAEDINRELSLEEMKEWLVGLDGNHLETLYDNGFTDKASLLGLTMGALTEVNDSIKHKKGKLPVPFRSRLLANLALKKQPLPIVATGRLYISSICSLLNLFNSSLAGK